MLLIWLNCLPFLDASSHLYKRVCPSVGPSIRWSVCPSVRPYSVMRFFLNCKNWGFFHLGGTFGGSYGPPFMAYCVLPVPIWRWFPRCAILGDPWAKKNAHLIIIVLYLALLVLKSCFLSFFEVFDPCWGPNYPQGPHMDWYLFLSISPLQQTKI